MSLKPIDYEALKRPQTQPEPAAADEPRSPPAQASGAMTRAEWINIALVSLVVFLGFLWLLGGSVVPGPAPGPDIDVDGFHVLVVTPDDRSVLNADQNEFANSAKVADWVESNGGKYRRYPESQKLDNEEAVWQELRSHLSGSHRVAVLHDRRLTKMEMPAGIDAGIELLQGVK